MNDKTKPEAQARARYISVLQLMASAYDPSSQNGEALRETIAALSTPASHDAQQPAAFLTLSEASEGSEWPEAPLQLTEVGRKLPHGTYALYAQQPAVVGDAVELTLCCGREECGGECGNEWRGTAWYRKGARLPTP